MTDRLLQIFEHKRNSSAEFRAVQRKHGLILCPEDLFADWKTREGAMELHKGLHWINLELQEFLAASTDEKPEELADVLHFLVEFCILCGYDHTIVPTGGEGTDRLEVCLKASENDPFIFSDSDTNARFTILASLAVADTIKNKPWRQTLKIERDEEAFRGLVRGILYWFGATARTAGFDAQTIYDQFVRKEEINHTRVATGV